jgi:DNA-directed RNA polymerase sigma subunit (sigma70/sigma32)
MAVPEQHLSFLAFMERLHFLMVSLKLKEKRALILYHGLEGEKCCETFAEVGRQMGVSRESARLLYHRAIKKLAEHSDIDMLKDYWYFTS